MTVVRQEALGTIADAGKAVQDVEGYSRQTNETLDKRFAQVTGMIRIATIVAGAAALLSLVAIALILTR